MLGCEEAHWPETPQEAGGEDSKIRNDDAVGQIYVSVRGGYGPQLIKH